jgi:hypothetical protein
MMVTAYGDDERRRRASELGAFEFLTKPVDFDRLKAQLRQLPAGELKFRCDFNIYFLIYGIDCYKIAARPGARGGCGWRSKGALLAVNSLRKTAKTAGV